MKHRDRASEQDDLLRPRLVDMIDMRHELVKLADLIDWDWFEREWAGFFPSKEGRPATHPRLVAGLMYLQHVHRLSDDAVVARWSRILISSILLARRSFSTRRRSILPLSAAGATESVKKVRSGCSRRRSRPAGRPARWMTIASSASPSTRPSWKRTSPI